MPNTYTSITLTNKTTTNGVGQLYFGPFDFDYLNTGDLRFTFQNSQGNWVFIDVNSVDTTTKIVQLTSTPLANGAVVGNTSRVYRSTSTDSLVDFQSGSRIAESDLDKAYKQGLFVAQEVAEDPSESASREIQTTDDIANGAITAPKLATDAVETSKILDGAVTVNKLENALDLSNKLVNLPPNSITLNSTHYANIEAAINLENISGVLQEDHGGTGRGYVSNVLESILVPCDGSTYDLTTSRTLQTTNVTTAQEILGSVPTIITGSDIDYEPPSGATRVVYEFIVYMGAKQNSIVENAFKGFHKGAEVPQCYAVYCKHESGHDYGWISFKMSVPAWTGATDAFSIKARPTTSNAVSGKFHQVYNVYADNSTSPVGTPRVVKPYVGITAFG